MDAFKRVVDRKLPGVQLKLKVARWSVKEKTEELISLLKEKGDLFFNEIFDRDRTISEFVVTFLALLELVHLGVVRVFQPSQESDIRLVPQFDENGGGEDDAIPQTDN
jgi:segregation and condensation protein A